MGVVLERVVEHGHVHPAAGMALEGAADAGHGGAADPAALPGPVIDGVHARDRDLVVLPERLEVGVDVVAVAPPRRREAHEEVVERRVVVARHREPGRAQRGEEGAGGAELAQPRALREVARHHHEVGRDPVHRLHEGAEEAGPVAAEMEVGEVEDASGHGVASGGAMT